MQKALATSADRDALLSSSSSAPQADHVALEMDSRSGSPSFAQAQRLLSATDKLADGQRRLEESHRVALETEDLGTGILRDLRGQRETLEHTRDTVRRRAPLVLLCRVELILSLARSCTRRTGRSTGRRARSRR